jgi:hypothetical protein
MDFCVELALFPVRSTVLLSRYDTMFRTVQYSTVPLACSRIGAAPLECLLCSTLRGRSALYSAQLTQTSQTSVTLNSLLHDEVLQEDSALVMKNGGVRCISSVRNLWENWTGGTPSQSCTQILVNLPKCPTNPTIPRVTSLGVLRLMLQWLESLSHIFSPIGTLRIVVWIS